jgi:hypothetical protein
VYSPPQVVVEETILMTHPTHPMTVSLVRLPVTVNQVSSVMTDTVHHGKAVRLNLVSQIAVKQA